MALQSKLSTFIEQLHRRRVFRVAAVYGGVAFVLVQIVDATFELLAIPPIVGRLLVILLIAGFPVALIIAWFIKPAGDGERRSTTAQRGKPQLLIRQVTFSKGIEEYPALSPNGTQLAYTKELSGFRHIFIKHWDGGEERQVTKGEADCIQAAWSPNNARIIFVRSKQSGGKLEPADVFGVHHGGDIWKLELESGQEQKIIDNAFNPAYSPNGNRIAFDASRGGARRIWISDDHGRNAEQLTSDSSEAISHIMPNWSPDGTKIAFQQVESTQYGIKYIDMATRKITWITEDRFQDLNPVWSPGGTTVYFSSFRSGGINIWRTPVSSDESPQMQAQPMTTGAGQDVQITISGNDNRLAYSTLRQNADIWKLPVDPETGEVTGAPQQVIATTREDSRGAWSPDGKFIAINSDRTGDMNVWIYALEDGSFRQITKGPGGDFQPNWSPDGTRLTFFSSRSGSTSVWMVAIETAQMKQLTLEPSLNINPSNSPDGKYIAYQSDHGGRMEVWVMNADGTGQRQLTDVGVVGHFLCWSRDSDSVVFRTPFGEKPRTMRVTLDDKSVEAVESIVGGAHMSFSPDHTLIMDVVDHKVLWVSSLRSGKPKKIFQFEDLDIRIDYPVWSPDGRWILLDRFKPQGGDIWLMENFE